MLFWEEKARGKGKERDLFLFEKGIVNTKRKEGGRKFVFKNMLKVWIFCSVFKLREDPIQHSQYTPGVLKSVVIVILFHSCHRLSPSNRFLSFVEYCSTKSNHYCRVFCYL